jgi:hypothetical protein
MSTNENRKILGENEELTNNKSKSQKLQKNRAQKSDSKLKNQEKSIGCNLDDDFNKIDEELILKNVNLTEEDLKLKEINNGLFWKQVAESIRRELSESLEDNQQVILSRFYNNILIYLNFMLFLSFMK